MTNAMARAAIVVIVLLAAYLATGVAQVRPGELAVVRRFGRVAATPGPGLWLGYPWGIDRVDRVAIDRVRRVSVGFEPDADEIDGVAVPPGQLLTGDQNLIDVRAAVDYTVRAGEVEQYLMHRDTADAVIAAEAEAALAEWCAGRPIDEVVLTGKSALPRWLAGRVGQRLEAAKLGVEIQSASVAILQPPGRVRSAFEEVTRAQAAIRTYEQGAEREARQLSQSAEAEKYRMLQLAEGYRREQAAMAAADAAGFLARLDRYRADPSIVTVIWWEATGQMLLRLRDAGRVDILDHRLGPDGLDVTTTPPRPRRN